MSTSSCPSCGAPITFAIGSSAVVVCSHCNSVVARADRDLVSHGQVAALVDTDTPLRVGLPGKYRGLGFRLSGRTQLRHQAGGVWDEWYAAFDDGRWGWLAEAQGRFYVTFKVAAEAPPLDALQLDSRIAELGGLTVAEIGEAKVISAEGELPWVPEPGGVYAYADLTGPGQRFATIDYSEAPPIVFQGNETTLEELGLATAETRRARIAVTALKCPNCGGALDLKAPDETQRIWCPYCGAGLNVRNSGKLQQFAMLKHRVEPAIPLGTKGTIEGVEYVIAGFMQRAVKFDIEYYWTEYLLYNKANGFRWLVHSDDHWSFVTPLRPGEVMNYGRNVTYAGRSYRLFQDATAKVTYVAGEFYWRVEVGEHVDTSDYIAPPYGISKEVSTLGAREIAYSHARYMELQEVATAFNVRDLTRPTTIGPMQPFPGAQLGGTWLLMVALLFIAAIVLAVSLPARKQLEQTIDVASAPVTDGAPANARVVFTEPFTLDGKHNVEVKGMANIDNSWLYVEGDLVDENTGRFESFELPLEYYHGVDQGESWSEGRRSKTVHLAAPPPGKYTIALSMQWQEGQTPPPLQVRVREGVFRFTYFILALIAISIFPVLALLRRFSWEAQRWKDSANSPYGQWQSLTESDDDEE